MKLIILQKINKFLLVQLILFIIFTTALAQISLKTELIPIAEGWAKNQINAVIFRKNSVTTFKKNQYVAFYNADSKVVVAKRKLGTKNWQIQSTQFSGNTTNAHNSISLAVDGNGFLHLAWNHHNVSLQYSRSLKPESLEFSDKLSMTGADENRLTYPEFYNLPNGNLLFMYRDGASGNGKLVLNQYDTSNRKWTRLQSNLIDGEGKRNAYPQMTEAQFIFHGCGAKVQMWQPITTYVMPNQRMVAKAGKSPRVKNIHCRFVLKIRNM